MSAPAHESLLVRNVDANALGPGYIKGTVVRGHPVVWSLALCPGDAKQDPVVLCFKRMALIVFLALFLKVQYTVSYK